jgi:hypothetical protein
MALPLRILAWVVAIGLGAWIVRWFARVTGWLTGDSVIDLITGSGVMRYVRVFTLVPVWALVAAGLATLFIEGGRWLGRRRATVAGGAARAPRQGRPAPSRPAPPRQPAPAARPSAPSREPREQAPAPKSAPKVIPKVTPKAPAPAPARQPAPKPAAAEPAPTGTAAAPRPRRIPRRDVSS